MSSNGKSAARERGGSRQSRSSRSGGSSPASMKEVRSRPEVRLFTNMRERRKYDALKDLYAIIKSVEHLEIAYVKDAVGKDEYTDECNMLISQFKEAEKVLNTYPDFKDSGDFMRKYRMECPRAQDRLLRVGQAATVVMTQRAKSSQLNAAQCAAAFISMTDALMLKLKAVDDIVPYVREVCRTLNRVEGHQKLEGREKIDEWLVTLNGLRASDEITDEQARQMMLDFETTQAALMVHLKGE